MKKTMLCGFLAVLLVSEGFAGGDRKTSVRLLQPKKYVSQAEKARMLAARELAATATAVNPAPATSSRKGGIKVPSTQSMNITVTDLGQSINPFSVVTGGRNCVSVIPALNTVAFFRRGGPNDQGGATARPGNKVYVDLNTKGGVDGQWQVSRKSIFSDDLYTDQPNYDAAGANYAPRYPQGALWSAPGNTDTNQVQALTITRVLDGSNDTWGGLGKGWASLNPASTTKQSLWSSPDPLHFRTESMEVTSTGAVFVTEPEEDLSSGSVVFTDKLMIYKYTYNSATNSFDSTVTFIPFPNEGGDYATAISNTAIAFGPDGQTGYFAVAAANNFYDSTATYHPFIAKTTDGGATWSNLKFIHLNKRWNEMPSPEKDSFRDSLLIGNYVHFTEAGEIVPTTYDDPTKHPVDYLVTDIDLTVDQTNTAHLLASLNVSGFGDTLNATFPNGITYYPGYGSWNVDLYINNLDSSARGIYINQNQSLNGCFGDCAATDNFTEANRPQIARSEDGSVITFAWFDTDIAAYPPLSDDNNANPDLWIRSMRVGNGGLYYMSSQTRNITKGSDRDGLAFMGNVAPKLLNKANGHELAAVTVSFADFAGVTATWPITYQYLGGIAIPPATAIDSFPVVINQAPRILKNQGTVASVKAEASFKIYPNPSQQNQISLSVANLSAADARIQLFDATGKELRSWTRNLMANGTNIGLNLGQIKAGVYQVRISTAEKTLSQKLVVN